MMDSPAICLLEPAKNRHDKVTILGYDLAVVITCGLVKKAVPIRLGILFPLLTTI